MSPEDLDRTEELLWKHDPAAARELHARRHGHLTAEPWAWLLLLLLLLAWSIR